MPHVRAPQVFAVLSLDFFPFATRCSRDRPAIGSPWVPSLACLLILAGCASQPSAEKARADARWAPPVVASASNEVLPSEAQVIAAVDNENSVFFASGVTTVDAQGEQILQRHAQRLKADPKLVVVLTGHTDDQGSRSYNLAIAEQRVNAVFQVLRRYGVPAIQLRRYGVGEEMASRSCSSAECRKSMRRVELVYPK